MIDRGVEDTMREIEASAQARARMNREGITAADYFEHLGSIGASARLATPQPAATGQIDPAPTAEDYARALRSRGI